MVLKLGGLFINTIADPRIMVGNNFQSESKKSGDLFESLVKKDLKSRGFLTILKNIYMPGTGCEVDFIAFSEFGEEHIESKGGEPGGKKRPGAQRTDNVKKAIANGFLIKQVYPDIKFVVYFSAKPTPGSSSEIMINLALDSKTFDEVRYLDYEEIDYDQLEMSYE